MTDLGEFFSLLAFESTRSPILGPAFSLLASSRTRFRSLIRAEARRSGLSRSLGTLRCHERKLTGFVRLLFSTVFTTRDHNVARRGKLALIAVRTRRERTAEVVLAGAREVHLHRTEVNDRLILTQCRKP